MDLLIERYPEATLCLFVQKDLPEGEFSRLNVLPYSEDELIMLLQRQRCCCKKEMT